MIAPLTHWSVLATNFYLMGSIWANIFSWAPYLDMKWVPMFWAGIAMNLTFNATLVSWTIIHPMMWIDMGFGTPELVAEQINTMSIHTIPFMTAWFNYIFLSEAPLYISDMLITYAVILIYVPWNWYYW